MLQNQKKHNKIKLVLNANSRKMHTCISNVHLYLKIRSLILGLHNCILIAFEFENVTEKNPNMKN